MDEYPIKLHRLIPVMNDFIGKLQNFDTLITNETKSSAIRDILINVEDLRSCLKNSTELTDNKSQVLNDQIERLFSEFNWNVNYTIKSTDYLKFIDCCKSLAASIMKMLGKKNCGLLVLEMYFQTCIKLVNELSISVEENANVLKNLSLFQFLVKGFLSILSILKKFWYVIVPSQKKCSVLLCLDQSFKTLAIMGNVLDKRITHLNKYTLNRLKQCFNKILDLLFNPEEEFCNSEFITLMDSCLYKLDQVGYEMTSVASFDEGRKEFVTSLKPLMDELLCHAMTVSHISSREVVSDKIKSYSQQALTELEKLKNTGNDFASSAGRLSDLLCQLEEVVNVAILNLVLDVFIDIHNPLRNLVNKCNASTEGSKSANDLENEISNFDEHLDKIMHIGLFAVSCSTDVKKILEIRSCLASLESLEGELITTIISLYLSPNPHSRSTFQYIFKNWLEEVGKLKALMDMIIDPIAFCQVVQKRILTLVYELKDDDSPSVSKIRSNVSAALCYTKKLVKTLWKSTENEDEEVKKRVKVFIEGLQLAYQECQTSCSLLDQEIPLKERSSKILKRMELIITALNNVILSYNWTDASLSFEDDMSVHLSPIKLHDSDMYKLDGITPELVNATDADVLTPYINKGRIKMKERAILYKTPKHDKVNSPIVSPTAAKAKVIRGVTTEEQCGTPMTNKPRTATEEKSLRKSFRSRCCRILPRNLELQNSLDFELTELLANVTDLGNTFATDVERESKIRETVVIENSVKLESECGDTEDAQVFLGTLMRRKLDQSLKAIANSASLSIDKDSNYEFETPERINDLNAVQKKINFLIQQMKD